MCREHPIEEMAKAILEVGDNYDTCLEEDCITIAELIYAKGYRKASDVAEEIFAELELKAPFFCENQIAYEHFNEELAELKKKYTESEKENG